MGQRQCDTLSSQVVSILSGPKGCFFVGFSQADVAGDFEEAEERVGLRHTISCGDR